jgi:hypothetical protein
MHGSPTNIKPQPMKFLFYITLYIFKCFKRSLNSHYIFWLIDITKVIRFYISSIAKICEFLLVQKK